MSAEILRAAASKMRKRAEGATGSPWQSILIEDEDGSADSYVISLTGFPCVGEDVGESMAGRDAEHIASWHPAVALAVAVWLDREADEHERYVSQAVKNNGVRMAYANDRAQHAIAVARAYLGSAS